MKNYITVIGLEVHAELKTKTKAFCSCSTEFGSTPNTHVCPVCLGMPGALPVLNKQVVEFAIMTGVSQTDFSGYPDCRDSFIRSLNVTLNLAMDEQFVIHTPLMWIDKARTWALADSLGVFDIVRNDTLTCYNGIPGDGCGHCPACRLRNEGLKKYLESRK